MFHITFSKYFYPQTLWSFFQIFNVLWKKKIVKKKQTCQPNGTMLYLDLTFLINLEKRSSRCSQFFCSWRVNVLPFSFAVFQNLFFFVVSVSNCGTHGHFFFINYSFMPHFLVIKFSRPALYITVRYFEKQKIKHFWKLWFLIMSLVLGSILNEVS